MIKGLFKLLFALLILVLISPFVILGLMYQGNADANIPAEDYTEAATVENVLAAEIDLALEGLNTPGEDLVLSISETTMNALIYAFLTSENGPNPSYNPGDDCVDDACVIFTETFDINANATGTLRVTGFWVELFDNQLQIHMNASVQYNDGFTYATSVRLDFNIEDRTDEYYLAFDRVSLGRLPLTQSLFTRVLGWVENATGESVENPDALPVGTLDLETLSVSIPKAEIIQSIEEDPDQENGPLLAELLRIVFANELLTFKVLDGQLDVTLQSSLLFNEGPLDLDPALEDVFENPETFDPTASLTGLLESFILTAALSGEGTLMVDELLFNQVIAQSTAQVDGLSFTQTFAGIEGDMSEVSIDLASLVMDLTDTGMILTLSLNINGAFSQVRLNLVERASNDPLVLLYDVSELSIGEDENETEADYLVLENLAPILEALSANLSTSAVSINDAQQLQLDGRILQTTLEESMAGGGIDLSAIDTEEDAVLLILTFDGIINDTITAYGDALKDLLEDDLALTAIESVMNTLPSDEVDALLDSMNTLSDELASGAPSSETVDAFVDSYESLSALEKTALMESFETIMGAEIIDEFEGIIPE